MISRDHIRLYRPNQRGDLGVFRSWAVMFKNLMDSRELIWELFKRNFLAAYRKSFLGIAWIIVAPFFGILSWILLQRSGILNAGELSVPYPVYVLIGSTMWGLFLNLYHAASATLTAGESLVLQINYPREVLLIQKVAEQLANFSIALALALAAMALFGVMPGWRALYFPLVALPLFLLAAGMGLVTSMIAVVAIDVTKLATVVLGLAMWATPIIYSPTHGNAFLQNLIAVNPLTYLVCSARDIVLYGRLYDSTGYFVCAGAALLFFLMSWRLFYVAEDRIIERMI